MYKDIKSELQGLIEGENDFLANAGNFCALIFLRVKSLNWAGFYFLNNDELVLGPFQGKPACIRIAMGKGVCGTAAKERKTIIVPNVHQFDGHIACDSISNSEIVIPLIKDSKLIGVFDADSPAFDRFGNQDKEGLEELVNIFLSASEISSIERYCGHQ